MPRKKIIVHRNLYSRIPSQHVWMLDQALLQAANHALGILRKSLDRPFRRDPARPGQPPRKRSGLVKESYVVRSLGPGEVEIVSQGPGSKIADIMEYGGSPAFIRAKSKKALTIPVTVREARQVGRDIAKRRRKGGKRISQLKLAGTFKVGGQLYLLRKHARRRAIRPRPHLAPAIQRATPRMQSIIRTAARKVARLEMQRLDRAVRPLAGQISPFKQAFDRTK